MASTLHATPAAHSLAEALFQLADERQQLDAVAAEMAAIGSAIRDNPAVGAFFTNPVVKEADRQGVVERTFIASASPLVGNFVRLLMAKDALGELGGVSDEFARLVAARDGKVDVDVTVARQLGAQELELVRQRISSAISADAVVRQRVDESIIGGIIIRVGDKLIDGSVQAQLKSIEARLLSAV